MARVSSPPLPGDFPPTSPTPAPTPGPAATPKVATTCRSAALSPAPGTPIPTQVTAGRSMALRWSNDSPPSGKTGGDFSPPSFMEVLLSGAPAVASQESVLPIQMTSAAATGSPPSRAPRIILKEADRERMLAARAVDADGWTTAESRRARKKQRYQEYRPRRPVPVDLRGRCFNCFSLEHRAASCRSKPRCFRCCALGHRSSACPLVAGGFRPEERRHPQWEWQPSACPLVAGGTRPEVRSQPRREWQPKPSLAGTWAAPGAAAAATVATAHEGAEGSQGRKQRRRNRRRGSHGRQDPPTGGRMVLLRCVQARMMVWRLGSGSRVPEKSWIVRPP
ncbi:unnamed protein product [Urochloa humidicola]